LAVDTVAAASGDLGPDCHLAVSPSNVPCDVKAASRATATRSRHHTGHDTETQIRPISFVLAEEKCQNRKASQSRNLFHQAGSPSPRKSRAILQASLKIPGSRRNAHSEETDQEERWMTKVKTDSTHPG